MKRKIFCGRMMFGVSDARLKIKRQAFADDGKTPIVTLEGYPILWGQNSSDRGGYVVQLAKGAANFTTPALALYHHNFEDVIGNTANGTLRVMQADDVGVPVEIDLPNTSVGRDVGVLVASKYISGMSFSMANGFEEYSEARENNTDIVYVTKFTVDEVTVTPIPAFNGTTIDVADPDDDDDEDDPPAGSGVAEVMPGGMSRLRDARQNLFRSRLYILKSSKKG